MERIRVLIAGGGVAALEGLLALRDLAEDLVELKLLAPDPHFSYRPLAVGEPFGLGKSRRYDLAGICADQRATLRLGALEEVDVDRRLVRTRAGDELPYDRLLVAVGARPEVGLEGAIGVQGPGYTSRFATVLRQLERRRIRRVAFAVPPGASWPLPLYELALMTAARVREQELRKVELRFVTPEAAPLEVFGQRASDEVARMFEERGVEVLCELHAAAVQEDGSLAVVPASRGPVPADAVVSLPRLVGPRIKGLPQTGDGFIPVGDDGVVLGERDVLAAGDATSFGLKQGGIAAQQALAAAETIAAQAGAPVEPRGFRPVLRGMLLTGERPRYMQAEVAGGRGEDWQVSDHALWWPPGKIAGRYLSPYLALHRDLERGDGDLPLELRLDREARPVRG